MRPHAQVGRDLRSGEVSAQVRGIILVERGQPAGEHRVTDGPAADRRDHGVRLSAEVGQPRLDGLGMIDPVRAHERGVGDGTVGQRADDADDLVRGAEVGGQMRADPTGGTEEEDAHRPSL